MKGRPIIIRIMIILQPTSACEAFHNRPTSSDQAARSPIVKNFTYFMTIEQNCYVDIR
jgi:hypothetical protein